MKMQNRLSQSLRALKYLKALMSTEPCSDADRTSDTAGSGVFTEAQPCEAIKGRCTQQKEGQKKPFFLFLLAYFVVPETKPRASHGPGKHPIRRHISSPALC